MRFVFRNTVHPLRIAKTLQAILKDKGIRIRKTEAMEIVAVMFGYANWHELQKSAREDNRPSPWDDEAGDAIGRMRHSFYITVLVEKLELAKALAGEVASMLAPSARKAPPARQEPWRALMKVDTGGRFLQFTPPTHYGEIVEWWKENDGFHTRHPLVLTHEGLDYEVLLSLSGEHDTETDDVVIRDAFCYLVRSGEVFGVLALTVVEISEHTTKYDFYNACDLVSCDETKIAGPLCDDPAFDSVMENGGIVTMVFEWEIATARIGSGLGHAFMQTVGEALRSLVGNSVLVAMAVDPLQYSAVFINERLNMSNYLAARTHLVRHLVSTFPTTAFGPKARFKPLDCLPVFTEDEEAESLYLLNAFLTKHAPEMLGPGVRGGSPLLSPELRASNQPETVTDPMQPAVIGPGEFPAGFDIQWACTALSFGPHVDLWRHMPDDLIRITVHYRSGAKTVEGHAHLDRLVFDFDNGTSLGLEGAYLLGGDLYGKYPPVVKTGSDKVLKLNPFTDRYSVSDLFSVLKINTMLVFRGDVDGPLVWPREPTVIERDAPRAVGR